MAKQTLRSPVSLEAEWVDETEPFSELVGSPLSDGGPTVVFGIADEPRTELVLTVPFGSVNPAHGLVQSLKPPMYGMGLLPLGLPNQAPLPISSA